MRMIQMVKNSTLISLKKIKYYKGNFLFELLQHIYLFIVTIYFTQFLYHIGLNKYYDRNTLLLLLSIDIFILKTLSVGILPGLIALARHIHFGVLDKSLTLPISLRIRYIFSHIDLSGVLSLALPIILFFKTVFAAQVNLSPQKYAILGLCCILSLIVGYSFLLICTALAFYFPSKGILHALLTSSGMIRLFPSVVFPPFLITIYTWIIPVHYLSKFPALNTFSNRFGSLTTFFFIFVIWFFAAEMFWRLAKKRYVSTG